MNLQGAFNSALTTFAGAGVMNKFKDTSEAIKKAAYKERDNMYNALNEAAEGEEATLRQTRADFAQDIQEGFANNRSGLRQNALDAGLIHESKPAINEEAGSHANERTSTQVQAIRRNRMIRSLKPEGQNRMVPGGIEYGK